jgi:hypothetical protein
MIPREPPDDCFYIQNYQVMIGKQRLDLTVDPVPDLAIEIDFVICKSELTCVVFIIRHTPFSEN